MNFNQTDKGVIAESKLLLNLQNCMEENKSNFLLYQQRHLVITSDHNSFFFFMASLQSQLKHCIQLPKLGNEEKSNKIIKQQLRMTYKERFRV